MAIYQFYLAAIPRIGLLKKYNYVPSRIGVSTESGYFESNTEEYWKLSRINSDEIIHKISALVDAADWGNDQSTSTWKTYTDELDNDASMDKNEESRQIIRLSFRADLRQKGLLFLKEIVHLSKEHDWLLMDNKGNLSEPTFEGITKLIEASNAHLFLQDPIKYLTNLGRDM